MREISVKARKTVITNTGRTIAFLIGTAGTLRGVVWEAIMYRLGVRDRVIQRILRHANVSTTATYYIKTADDDVRGAMAKLKIGSQSRQIKRTSSGQ
jgi:integrase